MTALFLSPLSLLTWPFRTSEPTVEDNGKVTDEEGRRIVNDLIAAGACDSDYGVQMLMAVYPDQF